MHVGRYLGALAAILVLLYTIVALAGDGNKLLTPKLGLDLQGGASVVLQPKTTPKSGQLDTAVQILTRRVNGAGVAEAEVVTQGTNIVVSVPGGNRESVKQIATTAQLRFREVLEALPGNPNTPVPTAAPTASSPSVTTSIVPTPAPTKTSSGRALSGALLAATPSPTPKASAKPTPTPTPTPTGTAAPDDGTVHTGATYTPAAFAALDCSKPENRRGASDDNPDAQIVACSEDGAEKFHLDVAKVRGNDVKGATAQRDQQLGAWQVIVSFTGKGQNKFTDLTAATVGQRVAIVLDGVVISAPTIQSRIDGDAQITGSFNQKTSGDLANTLKYGALPLSFRPGQTQTVSP